LIILYELSASAKKAFTHSSCTHDFFPGVMRVDEKAAGRRKNGRKFYVVTEEGGAICFALSSSSACQATHFNLAKMKAACG
jgi:hypothetical protein